MDRSLLQRKSLAELREIASTLELRGYQRIRKADLIDLILEAGAAASSAATDPASDASDASDGEASAGADTSDADDQSSDGGAAPDQPETTQPTTEQSDAEASDNGRHQARDGEVPAPRQRARARRRDEEQAAAGDEPEVRAAPPDGARDEGEDGSDAEGAAGSDDGQDARARAKRERRRKSRGGAGTQHQQNGGDDAEVREGVLDLLPEGYGFLRVTGYFAGSRDVYVSQSFVRRFELRRGDKVAGPIRRNKNSDKFPALARVDTIEGEPVGDQRGQRTDFRDLTPLHPDQRLPLETGPGTPMSMRLVNLMAPIGKGQRGLLVSPPKAGKTTVLKQLAHAIEHNAPDVHLMVLLVDERPEEVTDFERSTSGEVVSSTFDRPAEDHTQVAELTIERAKRLVERGRDVVILLDSITRLARAYNLSAPTTGRILSGGLDAAALAPPKRFFGAARNIEDGGSLTIIATALIETGSKMDEVIFEEFKGTGNMELRLDRRMEQKRLFPALDIAASGTRREELLLGEDDLETVWKLRRLLTTMDTEAGLSLLMDKLGATRDNAQFLALVAKSNL